MTVHVFQALNVVTVQGTGQSRRWHGLASVSTPHALPPANAAESMARRRCVVPNGRKKKSCPAQAHPLWLYGCAQVAAPRHVPALARGMAGAIKVHEANQEEVVGPAMVARTEAKIEMGVRYEAGVPSPMEGAHFNEPIVVDGLVAKTGGGALGCPVQYIKLSAWCESGRGRTLNT